MKKYVLRFVLFSMLILVSFPALAWIGMPTPRLQVDGRYLKDPHGNIVNLHGVAITPSPWFNGGHIGEWRWSNFDVEGCLAYNNSIIDALTDTSNGWYMSYIRLHMDPHWTNTPGCVPDGHELPNCFNVDRFIKYLDEVYIPLAEYAISRGLYVVLRPPGVAPHVIGVEDDYNYAEYLMTVWDIVSSHPWIQSQDEIMLELANEPVQIRLADGTVGANTQAHFDVLVEIFQPIADKIRENGFHNVLWIPGSGYQSHYKGFAVNPIQGENIGYAVHIYPGYWGGVRNYERFRSAWDENVKPVADFAPIIITEIDWSPNGVDAWGDGITGVAGGEGFGANFKKITDESGNVSWNLLAPENLLHRGEPDGELAYGGDPEACAYPTFHWWQEYANYEYPRPNFENRSISDNGDGTFTNPVIHADFPNTDVIRVESKYYMVSSNEHISAGISVLKSSDLVSWEYGSNPLQRIENAGVEELESDIKVLDHSGLKYNEGTFFIVFNSTNENSYLLSTTNPQGLWSLKELSQLYLQPELLFEDDKTYVIHGSETITLTELDGSFEPIGDDIVLIDRLGDDFKNKRIYTVNDFYYITATDNNSGIQTVLRSNNLSGPYEENILLAENGISNLSLIETQTGEWWSLLNKDSGILGQLPILMPVNWVDGWPEIEFEDGLYTSLQKPDVGMGFFAINLPTNENFRHYTTGLQWGWYNLTDNSKWSLFDRPGFIRLQTVDVTDNLLEAKNVLTQRIFGYHADETNSYGTIRLDISEMLNGDIAGLAIHQNPYAYIGVTLEGDDAKIIMKNEDAIELGAIINEEVIYLRAVVNLADEKVEFFYSLDNEDYIPFGTDFNLGNDVSMSTGNRFAIFNYATIETGGFVDVDWFSTDAVFSEDMFYDPNFTGYTEDQLTLEELFADADNIQMITGNSKPFAINALYKDGSLENVVRKADIQNTNPDVAAIVNGQLIGKKDGTTTFTVIYAGELAGSDTIEFNVTVMTFPLINELFNPSIWEPGTFDEETNTLITGQWGFGGWTYDQGLNLSDYKYLVVKLKEPTTSGASFRIFDENNYWAAQYAFNVGSSTEFVVPLGHMYKTVNGQQVKLNPATIYIVGFWSNGGIPIKIDDIFLSNSDEYFVPISIEKIELPAIQENDIVDVYSLTGVLLRTSIIRKDATTGLPQGIYIVGNAKRGFQRVIVQQYSY